MDNKFQASFIPKRPVVVTQNSAPVHKSPISLFLIIAVIIFILSILAFGGVYFYKSYITKENTKKQDQIKAEVAAFDQKLTNELTLLKSRLDSGNQLLTNHIAASAFFTLLQDITVKTVKFSDFSFTAGTDGKISVSMKGEALNYAAVAFQSDTMVTNEFLKNPILSDLHLDETKGIVTFNVKTEVDPSVVSYKKAFVATPAVAPPASAPVASSTPS